MSAPAYQSRCDRSKRGAAGAGATPRSERLGKESQEARERRLIKEAGAGRRPQILVGVEHRQTSQGPHLLCRLSLRVDGKAVQCSRSQPTMVTGITAPSTNGTTSLAITLAPLTGPRASVVAPAREPTCSRPRGSRP